MPNKRQPDGLFHADQCHQVSVDENSHETLSIRLSEAMATVTGDDPCDLPPLYDVIDPDALDALFPPLSAERHQSDQSPLEIVFSWCGHAVRVQQSGAISITTQSITPKIGTDGASSAVVAAEAPPNTESSTHEYTAAEDTATAVVLAVSDAVGVDPRDLREQLFDRINPDALTDLFSSKVNGTPRPGGYVSFAFQGYFVTVSSEGTITIQSELSQLKHNGGNILVVGDVPDDVFTTARSFLLGEPKPTQHDLFALLDQSPAGLQQPIAPAQPASGAVEVLDYQTPVRSARTSDSPAARQTHNPKITRVAGELSDLQTALIQTLARHDYDSDSPDGTDLRLSIETLRPILADADTDVATFVQPIQQTVKAVGAVGYYVLPVDRHASQIQELEADFDAVIELRIGSSGPEQRWRLRNTGYTTRWFSLD
jgi:hypothetical protein